ncbi:hypothetical protein [Shewanella algae]|uniref:hypothetical protein n=1 Tax=Shewanella algae TaxID=38313 RepID=UPI001AACCA1A|nr:hypothetical protein [Shewanella algae]MCE9780675.1 hypothetical protein [Shewanella algae]MCE9825434.1 hypothetical protein [Shewanella algae]QTE81554.1 hypothetical protein JKK46_18180 [Shewanella algae]
MEVNQEQSQRRGAKKIRFDNQELVKTSFWVSQIFMIIATVAGVYLAAQEGLSQAIKFDSLTNMQNNYHLQHSLYEELKDNVTVITEYAERIEKEKPYNIKEYHPVMADFVWQNMKYSAYTLETPSDILSGARRFYMGSEDIVGKIERKFYGPSFGTKQLRVLIEEVETKTLPKLEQSYKKMADELKRAGMDVN